MNTSPDVNPQGGIYPSDVGLTTEMTPLADGSRIGVTLKYVYDPNKIWFVLRASYGRERKAYQFIQNDHTDAYIPMHYVFKIQGRRRKKTLEPLLPNILFVYADKEKVESYVKHTPALSFLRYYYNHLIKDANGDNPPLTIGFDDMMNFVNVTNIDNEHIRLVEPSECNFKSGDIVRVVEGVFKGICGRVARVTGQQRVIVTIEGLCSVATAYIPTAFLETKN